MESQGIGAFSPHLSRHTAPSDSRLLTNLIKAERNYITHLRASVTAAHGASAALSAWGTSEAPDVADASARLGNLLAACADVQSTHVAAIEGYRAALKDVADREASIRTVVRDRDILVGRLIKASQKSASASSKKSPEERAEKVAKAQRELSACEQVLVSEEAALVGVKRRTFKEALTMRMKTMGDAGAALVDAAKEAIMLLNDFDSNAYQAPYNLSEFDDSVMQGSGQDMQPYHPYRTGTEEGAYDQMAINHPNFENSSVTPSQSASQIYQPHPNRDSTSYNAPFGGIAEGEPQAGKMGAGQQGDESDSDEEDWQRSFGMGNDQMMVHQGNGGVLPAPHQLDARAGAESDFVPHAAPPADYTKQDMPNHQGSYQGSGYKASPAPTPPAKDQDKRLSRSTSLKKKKQPDDSSHNEPRQLNYVPMPPIPTAPRLDSNGVNMAPVPSAPKLYMPGASGAQDDSSSDGEGNTVAHRGGGSTWNTRSQSRRDDDASSDEGTARASQVHGARKGGFFGKMGRLFKSESKADDRQAGENASPERRTRRISGQWDTRTNTNLRNSFRVKDPSSVGRRQSALRGPLVAPEADSSDEDQVNERELVRHVNKGPPLWQTQKSSSDVGAAKTLTSDVTRPSTLRRTPSASVNVGPMSWKAHQQAEGMEKGKKQDQHGNTAAPTLNASSTMLSAAPSKSKKKKAGKAPESVDGGSEIGTQSTRTRPHDAAVQRNSIIVAGDASSGIRRSDSLNYGSVRAGQGSLAKRSSKRLSAMSTQQVHGHGSKSGSAFSPGDPSGKFATTSWVAKSNIKGDGMDKDDVAAPAAPGKPVPIKAPTPTRAHRAAVGQGDLEPPKHVPQPSRTMSPPVKPALKMYGANDNTRTGSTASGQATDIPRLPDPITAPPPASTLLNRQDNARASQTGDSRSPGSTLSLNRDDSIDGTGRLHIPALNEQPKQSAPAVGQSRTALPRIDMPASEPFKVDLEGKDKQPSTPMKERLQGSADQEPLLTPNERVAYTTFLAEGDADKGKSNEEPQHEQPEGVTRTTVTRASVGSGVLGPKNVPPTALKQSPPGKLSRSYSGDVNLSSDSSEDEGAVKRSVAPSQAHTGATSAAFADGHASIVKPASILSNSHLHAPVGGAEGAERSPEGSGVGSTVSRRKSVRMAPDVKLPPETPPGEASGRSSYVPSMHRSASRPQEAPSQLSSRIAPPPPAPPRLSAHMERPVDLGDMRERSGWSTRIGMSRDDDSSDDDDPNGGDGANDYEAARRNFGSISRSWGKATGKGDSTATKGGAKSTNSTPKKKKKVANSGYNPAIPLPAGMEVVGRSASKRGK